MAQLRLVTSVGISHNDYGLLFLSWDNSGADNCGGGSGGKDNCLFRWLKLNQIQVGCPS